MPTASYRACSLADMDGSIPLPFLPPSHAITVGPRRWCSSPAISALHYLHVVFLRPDRIVSLRVHSCARLDSRPRLGPARPTRSEMWPRWGNFPLVGSYAQPIVGAFARQRRDAEGAGGSNPHDRGFLPYQTSCEDPAQRVSLPRPRANSGWNSLTLDRETTLFRMARV